MSKLNSKQAAHPPGSPRPMTPNAAIHHAPSQDPWLGILRFSDKTLPMLEAARMAALTAVRMGGKSAPLMRASRFFGASAQALAGARSLVHARLAWQTQSWEHVVSHTTTGVGYFALIFPGGLAVGTALVTGSTVYRWVRRRQNTQQVANDDLPQTFA